MVLMKFEVMNCVVLTRWDLQGLRALGWKGTQVFQLVLED